MAGERKDYYGALGVSRTATAEEITRAYRDAAKTDHPDKYTDPAEQEAATRRQQMRNVAYGILNDADRRREYDRSRDDALRMAVDLAIEINRDGDEDGAKVQALNDLIEMHGLGDEELEKALDDREKEAGVSPSAAEQDAQEEAPGEAASFDDVDDGGAFRSSFHHSSYAPPPPKPYPDPRELLDAPETSDKLRSTCAKKFRAALRDNKIDGAWMKEFIDGAPGWAHARHGSLGLEKLDEIARHIDRALVMHPKLGDHIVDEMRALTEACLSQGLWDSYGEISSWSSDIKRPPWDKLMATVAETPGLMGKVFPESYLHERMSFDDIEHGYGRAHTTKHIAQWMVENGHLDRAWPARFRAWSEEKSGGVKNGPDGYGARMREYLIEEIEHNVSRRDAQKQAAAPRRDFGI